ncbi:MAG: acyl transferase [Marinirhabdus sp.]
MGAGTDVAEIFSVNTEEAFLQRALKTFRFQHSTVPVYRKFCDLMKVNAQAVSTLEEIPFLPIQFFKYHKVFPQNKPYELVFSSSGTTGQKPSKHFVLDKTIYSKSLTKAFTLFYGAPGSYTVLALLPSYLERAGSSLVYMVQHIIRLSKNKASGFYLKPENKLIETLEKLEAGNKKTLLIGVSFALLDLVEAHKFNLKNTIVMETGGMKGRRKELIREALHEKLNRGFGTTAIHSEYGMTELLSQAYSKGDGLFCCPPWMRVRTRDTKNPTRYVVGSTGGINIIDLANVHSCSFIATSDLGKVHKNGTFEVLGRFDTSEVRGCNLMVP